VGGGAECDVQQHRLLRPGRKADRQRIQPDQLVDPAPRRHGRDGIGRGDADHVGVDRHAHIVFHGAGVVAVADRGDAHAGLARALDRAAHGEGAADLAHAVVAVDHQGAGMVLDDARPAGRVDRALEEPVGVVRHAHHAVRMDAAQVRAHQMLAQQLGVVSARAALPEDAGDHAHETREREPPLVLDPRILRHFAPRCSPERLWPSRPPGSTFAAGKARAGLAMRGAIVRQSGETATGSGE
jgi:hypothetical protein